MQNSIKGVKNPCGLNNRLSNRNPATQRCANNLFVFSATLYRGMGLQLCFSTRSINGLSALVSIYSVSKVLMQKIIKSSFTLSVCDGVPLWQDQKYQSTAADGNEIVLLIESWGLQKRIFFFSHRPNSFSCQTIWSHSKDYFFFLFTSPACRANCLVELACPKIWKGLNEYDGTGSATNYCYYKIY